MGEKHWIQFIRIELDRLRIHFTTEDGNVIVIHVVQYEACIDDAWHAIVRYDEAHGFFHQDVMSPTGQQQKTPKLMIDKKSALTEAIRDLKQNWQTYRKNYEDKYHDRK